ncbi:MAG TPA: RNA 3'-terminal phosphate cyclase [Pyrinomonadaceae bacterium]|jgi:RNA 3'-terminal phosphate cyclase (ATP)|nr:RNA 3'-terminal phosphate cyclase [Pyrinomonadaceae bacterium]
MLTIDGSQGEGGGQIIRTSLALALVTGTPFRIYNVRARRDRPVLQRQHLTAVNAAAAIGRARVEGARVGASEFTFVPGEVAAGEYAFDIGTAGSTTLVLQTVLPPLMLAAAPSLLTLEGGTHNSHAPPFEFIERTFLPLLARTGARITAQLERYGFYPRGGGRIAVMIEPAANFLRLDIRARGPVRTQRARALVVNLPPAIAERELSIIRRELGWSDEQLRVETSDNAYSAGNVVTIEIESDHVNEILTAIGERGVRAEIIAERVAKEARRYLSIDAPIGEHLADQLLLPLALARGGSYTTGPLSLHTTTNIEIIKKFLPLEIQTSQVKNEVWKIEIPAGWKESAEGKG